MSRLICGSRLRLKWMYLVRSRRAVLLAAQIERIHIYRNSAKTAVLCGRDTVQIISKDLENLSFQHVKERLSSICEVEVNDFLIHIRYERHRIVCFKGGRVLIHGTNDEKVANSLLARLLGI